MDTSNIASRLQYYLRQKWPDRENLQVVSLQQVPGGASRETFRITITYVRSEKENLHEISQGLILRRDPQTSLIDTERALEFNTYAAVHGRGIPVPEPVLLEEDPSHLGNAFSLMAEIPDCATTPARFAESDFAPLRSTTGKQKWEILGKLASLDPEQLGVTTFMPNSEPQACASEQLEYWANVIEQDALHPQPIAQAAIRWLRGHLPAPPRKLVLVHGDYRSGNFLYDTLGNIRGILDWEMAHLGDPLEDLAWSLDPLWGWPNTHLAGGLLSREDAIRIWQDTSGFVVDPEAFHWWQIFASLKGLAIWVSSSEDFANGASKEPILAVAGWVMTDRHNRILLDRLSPLIQASSRAKYPLAQVSAAADDGAQS